MVWIGCFRIVNLVRNHEIIGCVNLLGKEKVKMQTTSLCLVYTPVIKVRNRIFKKKKGSKQEQAGWTSDLQETSSVLLLPISSLQGFAVTIAILEHY
jgi:hypothetical protein